MNATTSPEPPVARPHEGLLDWLATHNIEHEVHHHRQSFTARETARAEGVDPHSFAKVVGIVTDDGRNVLLVLDAVDHVDLAKARRALSVRHVRLLTEGELEALAPGCAAGAMPAVGALFGLPMIADYAVRDDRDISFNAGSHDFSVRVDRAAWERATAVTYADLAEATDTLPAWASS